MAALRTALPPYEHRLRSDAIAARVIAAIKALPGAIVALYSPVRHEADVMGLLPLLGAHGAAAAFPRVQGSGLAFHRVEAVADLRKGAFGVREPSPGAPQVSPTIVLVPGLAFSRDFHRLGYGKGFYDRVLKELRAQGPVQAWGVCFGFQLHDSVPTEAHDEALDCILTENETLVRGKS